MKTSGERKSKSLVAPKKHNTTAVCAGVEKPGSRNHGRQPKGIGGSRYIGTKENQDVLPFSVASVVGKQLPNNCILELATGQCHPSSKIKLQLFPIDEGTRMGLEMDGHNPYLELTLRARKKISSVLKHLNRKWGSSSVAKGEIVLFPFDIELDKLVTYVRWTLNESGTSAGDIYAAIGSPAVFRMRYGWLFGSSPKNLEPHLESEGNTEACCRTQLNNWDRDAKNGATSAELEPVDLIRKAADGLTNAQLLSQDVAVDGMGEQVKVDNVITRTTVSWDDTFTNLSIGGLLSEVSLLGKIKHNENETNGMMTTKKSTPPTQLISSDISMGALFSESSLQGKTNNWGGGAVIANQSSLFPWDNSMTTLSIGGLLSESSLQGKSQQQPTLLISDSFDAFISRQFNNNNNNNTNPPPPPPQVSKPPPSSSSSSSSLQQESQCSSILDAEETCHAFPSRKLYDAVATSRGGGLRVGSGNAQE